MKVLITGGAGKCGTALVDLPHEKIFLDCVPCPESLKGQTYVQASLGEPEKLIRAMKGCDAIIHLAHLWPDPKNNTEETCSRNTDVTRELLKMAAYLKVDRVIYASSNHAVGMFEIENTPKLLQPDHGLKIDKHAPHQPDSQYGLGKAFCEDLGRFYSSNGGSKFYAIRIGTIFEAHQDHPYAAAENGVKVGNWKRGSEDYDYQVKRVKATWMSRRDFAQMIDLCLKYEGPAFDIFYGVSDNERRWFDIEDAKEKLGYRPQDNGSVWTEAPTSAGIALQ